MMNPPISLTEAETLAQVAAAGPGLRGRRQPADAAFRAELAEALSQLGRPVPEFLRDFVDWVDRRAKLFEAGDYPDKGVTITPDQLDGIAARFDLPVPVWIEHAETPLELGYLTAVESSDGELFGTIALTREADALVERSGARSLSIGLSPDLQTIREVSLVRTPRIPSAQLFHRQPDFAGRLIGDSEAEPWRARYEALEAESRADHARRTVDRWLAEGRLTPAESAVAEALLQAAAPIAFDGASLPAGRLFAQMIERRPPSPLFREWAPAGPDAAEALLLPEEAEFYRTHFPEIELGQIARLRRA